MDRQEAREASSAFKSHPTARFININFPVEEPKGFSEVYPEPQPQEQSYINNRPLFEMMKSPKPAGYESES